MLKTTGLIPIEFSTGSGLGRGPPISVDRNVADGLERFHERRRQVVRRRRGWRPSGRTRLDEEGAVSFLHEIPDRSRNPEQIVFEGERKSILNEAISSLRPRIRVMVEFGELREFSVRETALHLNISTHAAKTRLFHARVALRKSPVLKGIT